MVSTLGVQALTRSGEIEVRVNAFRRDNGDVVFAVQQREPNSAWSERLEPRANRLPAARSGRWANSSPVSVTWQVEIEEDTRVLAIVTQIEQIQGIEVEVDRLMEVETVQIETPVVVTTSRQSDNMMSAGTYEDDYGAFCGNPLNIQQGSRIDGTLSRQLSRALWQVNGNEVTASQIVPLLDLEIALWKSVAPPASLILFHQAMVAGLESVRSAYAQRDPNEVVIVIPVSQFSTEFLNVDRRTTWSSGLPEDVVTRLKVLGCVHAPEFDGGLMSGLRDR